MGKPVGTERYTLDLDPGLNRAFTEFAQRCGRPKAKLARLALVLLMQYEPEVVSQMIQEVNPAPWLKKLTPPIEKSAVVQELE